MSVIGLTLKGKGGHLALRHLLYRLHAAIDEDLDAGLGRGVDDGPPDVRLARCAGNANLLHSRRQHVTVLPVKTYLIQARAHTGSSEFVLANTPQLPSNALTRDAFSLPSARTTSAPRAASAFAESPSGFRVMARTAKVEVLSERRARATLVPWLPVAP